MELKCYYDHYDKKTHQNSDFFQGVRSVILDFEVSFEQRTADGFYFEIKRRCEAFL